MNMASFLNYGLLGLCGMVSFLFWRVIDREQRRAGQPRKGIVRFSIIFIILTLALSAAGLTLEITRILHDKQITDSHRREISDLKNGFEQETASLKDDLSSKKAEVARLEERVAGRDKLLAYLEDTLTRIGGQADRLPMQVSGTTQVSVPNHAFPVTVRYTERIPENQGVASEIRSMVSSATGKIREEKRAEQPARADPAGRGAAQP